ncbi:Uncharacterized protein BP5553_10666 [Venustampulla echinocandica]|uniref:Zn(2)-C6 fungal-type domain-containing protein n=1 Tax=Venustampulla echinocandica TaxID=2656787 RepID=A0A370T8P8_9HELO|nr:Uncharacterized protein BP5553_10666 [Venustampulla echinocandica]RDL29801.1 Uncharacterized protein BP5553_10666 [Venustampulla echinocandica]
MIGNSSTRSTAAAKGSENRRHPCILCQSRKIKCDRNAPCANCTRAHLECVFATTPPLQKRKKRFPEAELLARIRRYEDQLRKYGADIDAINRDGGIDVNGATTPKENAPCFAKLHPRASLSVKRSLKHVQNNLSINEEFQDAEDILQGSSDDELFDIANTKTHSSLTTDESDILFPSQAISDLSKYHPPTVHIFRLWQIFLDNVNPLIKVLHAPTVQQQVLDASADLENVPKGVEALMFSVYAVAITSLCEAACMSLLGDRKATLLSRYRAGAKQALRNAGFLRSSELIVLQAFFLLLFSSLHVSVDARSLCCLTGIVVRIARRMGLSSDGTSYGLAPFETEMRRRLWWQIIILDCRTSEVSGSGPSIVHRGWTTNLPTNINDSDLYPGMRDWPLEYPGPTEMVYALPRCEAIQRFLFTGCHTEDAASLDKGIDELEEHLQQKYLKFCDLSVPLHFFSVTMASSEVEKLRMCPRQPHVQATNRISSTEEKEKLFAHSLNLLEIHNKMMGCNTLTQFFWFISTNYPFPAHLYLLCALRSRASDDLTERAWRVLAESYDNRLYYNRQYEPTNPVSLMHPTLAHLTINAWEIREVGLGLYPVANAPPSFISEMRSLLADRISQAPHSQSRIFLSHSADMGTGDQNAKEFTYANVSSANTVQQSFDQSLTTSLPSPLWSSTSWDLWNDIVAAPKEIPDLNATFSSGFYQGNADSH